MRKFSLPLTLLLTVFCLPTAIAQRGVHGPRTVSAANTIVNEYTALTANAAVGATSISVANSALNANGRFTGNLAPGDLIIIYTVQGAWIRNQFDVGATDTTFGKIQTTGDYFNCGNWEFAQVLSVPNATTINLDCALKNGYGATGGAIRGQVIRVPRFTTLTINAGGVLTCDDWNGTVGGVLAVEVDGNMVVNGSVDATGRGFRGGSLAGDNTSTYGVNNTYHSNPDFGAQRGEGIVGYQADYTVFGGMYGRAPAGNAGAGGDAHNAGGGGGANGQNSVNPAAVWTGNGVPDQTLGGWVTAWNLEPPVNTMTLRTNANSEGGGRGGYSFSGNGSNNNATTLPPGNVGWGGDARNHQATGLGGRALHYDLLPGRLFLGGGGGAGDQNESQGGNGGDGGGLIYAMVFGNISGTGTITSNGNPGSNAQGVPAATSYSGSDGAGGGGGGGTIVLNAVGTLTGVTATANGGVGGNQVMTAGGLYFGNIFEAEGPGGGGGGGHIAISAGAITRNANGGNNGTTNSGGLTEFPPNGATRGCPGTNNATTTNFNITATNASICAGQSTTLTATLTGTPPTPNTVTWYSSSTGNTVLGTGLSYNTGVLGGTTTFWVGLCPGWFRIPVTVTVNVTPAAPTLGSNTPICSGQNLNLTANTVVGGTYTWTGPNSFSSSNEDPTISSATTAATGTYSLTISVGGCTSPMSTISVTVNPTPAAPTVGSNSPLCSGQTLNLTANTVVGATYAWTGPNSFSSTNEDPSIPSATTAATGTYSLTITVGGCTSAMSTVAVTVSNTPAAPTLGSNTPVCSGNNLNLTANTVVGGTYTWTGPNSFSSPAEDPTIASATTAASGTYSLTISVGGCVSPMSTISVTVNPTPAAPTLGSNSPICAGQNLNLTANTVVGATYAWTGPNSFSSSNEDPTIVSATTAASGTYSLTITLNGCVSPQSTLSVIVGNTPAAPTLGSNTPVCSGNSLNLTANTVVGGTYAWTGPNSFSSSNEDPTIPSATVAASGTYSLTISIGACSSPQSTISVTVNPTPAAPTVGSNSPICAGQNLNLTANTVVGATYAWTGPNSFSSSNEDPTIVSATTAASGTYSLTITLNGCASSQSTVSVVVGTTPAAPTLGSNTPVCSGNSLNLTANTVVGGTYAWTGPNSFTSSNEDPVIPSATVAASGTYSLTISIGACSSPQSTISVTVNPTPAAPTVGSNTPVCSGNTLNLTANTVVGATYAWTGPNSFSSSNEDPSIPSATVAASGTYSLTITVGGCTSAMSTVAVTINPTPATPTAGSNSPVCSGQTLNLTSNTVVGATYSWTGPNSFVSTNEDPSIPNATTAETGTYSVTITLNGCISPVGTVAVVVNQTPSSPGPGSNTPICEGQNLNLTSNTVASATYSWTGPNSFSSANEDPTITGATTAATGMYYVTVTVSGCTSPTDSVAVIVNPLPAVLAGSDVAICMGDSTPLSGTGTGTMVWSNASGLSCTNCSAPNASPSATTTYTLTLTDANGCVNTDDVIVTVNTLPVAVAGADVTLCNGDSTVLNGSGGGTYSWLPATNLSNTSSATPTADPSVTTTYTLQVTDINGCQDTDAVVVTVNALPAVTAGPDQSMCPTGNVPLNVTGAQSYVWTPASGLTCTNCSNPVATPAVTTTYYVTGTDSNGCINNDTIIVTVAPNLVITASADQTICVGDSASLSTNGTGTYVWSPAGSLSNAGSQTPMAGPAVTTTYTITVTDMSGCSGTDSVTVFVNQPVVATAAGATTICIGQSASLSATATGGDGNYTYTWNPGPLTGSPVSVSPTTTTTYSVDVTDSNGCADQQTVIVTVNPPITAAVSQPALSICTGGNTTLGATATGGNGVYSYTWSPATGLSSTTAQNPVAGPTATTTYTVVVNDNCGSPVDSATVTVTVNSPPTVTASSLSAGGCAPFCTDFSGQSNGSCSSTLWDFGDGGTNTTSANATYCFNAPGVYNSQFTCTDANGCSASSSVAITVTAPPVASFSVVGGTTVTLQSGTSVQVCFTDNSTGAVSWNWTFNSSTSTSQSPCFPVSDTGSYTATLVVTDAQGCTDSMAVTVNVENPCTDLFLPTAFSPNNDGQNDVLYLYGTCIKFMQLEIYSRWGERVFITNDPLIGWDGTWRGQACESAVFTYVLRATLSDDSQIEQQGNITLVK